MRHLPNLPNVVKGDVSIICKYREIAVCLLNLLKCVAADTDGRIIEGF